MSATSFQMKRNYVFPFLLIVKLMQTMLGELKYEKLEIEHTHTYTYNYNFSFNFVM